MRRLVVLLAACSAGEGHGSIVIENDDGIGTLHAGFFTGQPTCTTTATVGPCDVQDCVMKDVTWHTAGTLTLSGAFMSVTINPADDDSYLYETEGIVGGSVAASGADVPAFSLSATGPSTSTITAPPASGLLHITRASGLTVTWSGASPDTELVSITEGDPVTSTNVLCRFDAGAGTGTIPPDALMALQSPHGGFSMWTVDESSVDVGDWHIGLESNRRSKWPDGNPVTGETMVQ